MKQPSSGVIGVIHIDAGGHFAADRRAAWRDDERHLSTTIGRLARGGPGVPAMQENRFAVGEQPSVLRFPTGGRGRETIFCTAHLARLAADLSSELAMFRLRLADFDGDDAA
ncbi:MAG: hypothetical protein IIA67_03585 [Planctomycetes bacterium]|nr:hypothetical protein [Planctomycetota bacterium]